MTKKKSLSRGAWSVLMAAFLPALVAVATTAPLPAQEEASTLIVSTFHVEGMTCGGCEVGVRRVVRKLEGVDDVEASYEDGSAVVTYEPDKVTTDDIIAAIADLGYSAELEEGDAAETASTSK